MYAFLDRAVSSLPAPDQVLLRAMRSWVFSRAMGKHPAPVLAPHFGEIGWGDALTAFDAAMDTLDRRSTEVIAFSRPCHEHVEEIEAVILALWRATLNGSEVQANRILALLVDPAAIREVAVCLTLVCDRMRPVPGTPSRD